MLRYVLPLLAAGVVAVAQSPNPARFSVLSAGSLAGKAVQTMRPDGTTDVEYFLQRPRSRARSSWTLPLRHSRLPHRD